MTRIEDHWRRRNAAWVELNELKGELARMDLRTATEDEKERIDNALSEACSIYDFECKAIGATYNHNHRPQGVAHAREE